LATAKGEQLQYRHIQKAADFSQQFMNKVKGTEQVNSYFN
jgi:hypothetical protein